MGVEREHCPVSIRTNMAPQSGGPWVRCARPLLKCTEKEWHNPWMEDHGQGVARRWEPCEDGSLAWCLGFCMRAEEPGRADEVEECEASQEDTLHRVMVFASEGERPEQWGSPLGGC